jgi:arylsulfatase A-like enzyme
LAVALVLPTGSCRPRNDERPNIIVIVVDTLRADHLGSYGYAGDISPHLDRLAAESIVFDNCFSQAPWTPPSMGTLFTSLYPELHGLHRFKDNQFLDPESGRLRATVLPEEAVTLAESLRDAGYRTSAFIANPWLHAAWGLSQGFDSYDDSRVGKDTPAAHLVSGARTWLEGQARAEPFFMYLHFMEIHGPYVATERDFRLMWNALATETPHVLGDSESPGEHLNVHPPWADDALRRRLDYWQARYAAGVRLFDRRISGFLKYLRKSGILDHSYLIVTSDHGEELFEHGGWGHGESLHDHQLRVPMIIRPPKPEAEARRVARYVRLIDLMPTLLSLAGAAAPEAVQGEDLSPLLRGEDVGPPAAVFSTGVIEKPDMFSVRTQRYKLIVDGSERALFDLVTDPGETFDVSDRETTAAAELQELLTRHLLRSSAAGRLPARTVDIPEEMRERLRALGYLQ